MSASDPRAILESQRRAFMRELPVSAATRRDRLDRAIALISDNQDALTEAMWSDFGGRPRLLTKLTDLVASVTSLQMARKRVNKWMEPEKRSAAFPLNLLGARARVEYQPKGVVGIMAPWNYPVSLVFSPLAGALAAGNRAMVKPSERAPATSALIANLVTGAFDAEEVSVVTGDADVARAFSELPFDHLLFTGGTGVGRRVMAAAAGNLTPVTLELGGKSPTIIGRSAKLGLAAERIVLGKMMNAGQTCMAPDYLLVPRDQLDEVIGALRDAAQRTYPEVAGNEDYAQLVDERHLERIEAMRQEAERAGARLVTLQERGSDRRLPLTLVVDPDETIALMREEVFGPLLPIKAYDAIDEAVDFVNARERPLALYYFGEDDAERRRVLDRTISGTVAINEVVLQVAQEDLPFGGIGASGMGAYHGIEGFRTFSHARAVFTQSRFNVAKIAGLVPPFGKKLQRMIDFSLK